MTEARENCELRGDGRVNPFVLGEKGGERVKQTPLFGGAEVVQNEHVTGFDREKQESTSNVVPVYIISL